MGADPAILTRAPWTEWLDRTLGLEIERLRARYALSLDEFRGLYVSDAQVDDALRGGSLDVHRTPCSISSHRDPTLSGLQRAFDLSDPELAITLVAVAPEVDRKYEVVYAYLNDDVTRRYATVDLCLRVSGAPPAALNGQSRLLASRVVEVTRAELGRAWRTGAVVPTSAIRSFVLGEDAPVVPTARETSTAVASLASAIARGLHTVVLTTEDPLDDARAIAARSGLPLIEVDAAADALERRDALTRARLHECLVRYELTESDVESPTPPEWLRAACNDRVVTVFAVPPSMHTTNWRRLFRGTNYEEVVGRPLVASRRIELWSRALEHEQISCDAAAIETVGRLFALTAAQIQNACAVTAWALPDGVAQYDDLARAARRQRSTDFGLLAGRVEPRFGWDDLVVPPATERRLRELASAIRARARVFDEWMFARSGGSSVRAIFTGGPGTGKTMSAAVLSRELGLDVFRIDLSTVVSKYIGETEKNLERIFAAAAASDAILFFDEADALFGKRSEVKDAHDRYANLEIAYLLQRMEQHDGVMILATNLAKNLDEAFARRIHLEIEFPPPDASLRARIWRSTIPPDAPLRADVDVDFLAAQFQLTGGEIHNAALIAALLAAHEGSEITMDHLVRSVARLRTRQRKLPTAAEFKDYLMAVRADGH